jgi:hypothetical protein
MASKYHEIDFFKLPSGKVILAFIYDNIVTAECDLSLSPVGFSNLNTKNLSGFSTLGVKIFRSSKVEEKYFLVSTYEYESTFYLRIYKYEVDEIVYT